MEGRGGMEGRGQRRGQRRGTSLPPRVLNSDEGVGWHICASYFLPPPIPATSSTGRCESHTPPPFDFVYPPCGGCSFPASLTMTGAACNLHAAPFYFFSSPLVGGCPFSPASWASRRRVTHTPSPFHFVYPPTIGGDFFLLYK
jgi:hypothetical protein